VIKTNIFNKMNDVSVSTLSKMSFREEAVKYS